MYVTYEYYANSYHGTMPESAFTAAGQRAEAYIRYLTFGRGDAFIAESGAVWNAVCAVADVYHAAESRQGSTGPVKSENNDGYSVSYVTEQTDGQTAEEVTRKKAYEAAYMYLLPTGWLSRKVRCRNACECGHYAL